MIQGLNENDEAARTVVINLITSFVLWSLVVR